MGKVQRCLHATLAAVILWMAISITPQMVDALESAPATPLPAIISDAGGQAFLAIFPQQSQTQRVIFYAGMGAALATIPLPAASNLSVHTTVTATVYAQATPAGAAAGRFNLNAALANGGIAAPASVAVVLPFTELEEGHVITFSYRVDGSMAWGNLQQAHLMAGAAESIMYGQHWTVLYALSSQAVHAASSAHAFGASMAGVLAAPAKRVMILPNGRPMTRQVDGAPTYEEPVTVSYEEIVRVQGQREGRGVTRACAVRVAWDAGAWRFAGLPCAAPSYTPWVPLH